MRSLLIRGGTLVGPQGATAGDVLVEGERIVAVGPSLQCTTAAQVVDADGLLVLPGLTDPHVHLREPGDMHKEDLSSGTAAALAGGFTTVLAMPNTRPPLTSPETFAAVARLVAAKAVCDVGLFVGATPDNAVQAAAMRGPVGLKLYMGSTTGSLLVADAGGQIAHFARYPGLIAVHAEDEEAIRHFAAQGRARPPLCALLALARALTLAGHYRRHLHVCHVTTEAEAALIRAARNEGIAVTCEVTPHHLYLSQRDERRLGPLAGVNPPLRSEPERARLWAALGEVDCLATDHAPHTLEEKRGPQPPAGLPGLETALPLLLTAALEGRLSLGDVVRLTAVGPARVFRLAEKGLLAPGYEANLVLVDPNAEWTIGERPFYTRCGWSPFAGRKVRGRVERVFLRGRLAYDAGRLLLEPGSGRLIRPARSQPAGIAASALNPNIGP